jgi:SAM-dependent methyltransferase
MNALDLGERFDFVLVFESLHHSTNRPEAVKGIARHLHPRGWVLFSEPSWLHSISPDARSVQRELGWVERGVSIWGLKRDCRAAQLGNFRRFFEGPGPYEGRVCAFAWQAVKLVAANIAVAPRVNIWLAAQRL